MAEGRPTVSACIAVFNGATHLRKAIQSVVDQTMQPDEILLVDDGSTDDSTEIAHSFESVRVITQPNGGIGSARRTAVEAAKGEWIAFCDHDDWWLPSRLEAGLKLTGEADVTLIYGGVVHVDESGRESEGPLHTSPSAASIQHVVPHPEDIWTSSTLLRRSAVMEAGNFNPRFRSGEDMLMWFQLGGLGRIAQTPERLVYMLRREASTSSGSKKQFEYAVSLYEDEVLPNLDRWYAKESAEKRAWARRELEAKVGYTMSILAAYHDQEGQHRHAVDLYRKAAKLCPNSKGVWYRYLRSLLRIPAGPPI